MRVAREHAGHARHAHASLASESGNPYARPMAVIVRTSTGEAYLLEAGKIFVLSNAGPARARDALGVSDETFDAMVGMFGPPVGST